MIARGVIRRAGFRIMETVESFAKRTKVDDSGVILRVKRLSENSTLPTRASSLAAGYDLYR